MSDRTCGHPDGCPRPPRSPNAIWCALHDLRIRRTGKPGPVGSTRIIGDDRARFESHVDRTGGPDACHLWTGAPNPSGYGQMGVNWRSGRGAHIIAWEWAHGTPVPPDHRLTTKWFFHGAVGSQVNTAKLTEAQIPEIRAAIATGESDASIGRRYGVSDSAIRQIRIGRTWRRVA